ncbi:MAG: shikimate kinase [Roseiflexus sp.]
MVIGLIGMAGIGKSRWAARLADAGFTALHCDDLIAERLRNEQNADTVTVYDIGRWMGFPYEAHYAARERIYLACEQEVMIGIAERIAKEDNIVIDMTGSVVYLDMALIQRIRKRATMVYLADEPNLRKRLLAEYLAHPRPVVWNGMYQPYPDEPPAATLARCYSHLVHDRAMRYRQISDVTLEPAYHRNPAFTVTDFLTAINMIR